MKAMTCRVPLATQLQRVVVIEQLRADADAADAKSTSTSRCGTQNAAGPIVSK